MYEMIGKGYGDYWNFKGRYRVCKGSRASKKSKTTALDFISGMMEHSAANLLVVRKTYRTLKDSCFKELKWAIKQMGVEAFWEAKESPLELTYTPTGQKIYFRGFDDPMKITSITVEVGVLCWAWIEEAYEITKEEHFDMLDESIRGATPPGLYKQLTITFNPWNERHWLKRRFFDVQDPSIFTKTTNYMCNEFLDDDDIQVFERMKKNNPKRYKVAGLGEWGVVDGLVFENFEELDFDIDAVRQRPGIKSAFGLDFGYTHDPSALACVLVDEQRREIFVFDEMYQKGMTNRKIHQKITELGYSKERITADSAEPKSIDELRELGIQRIRKARKGKDSIKNGIQYIENFKIYIHPRCVNFLTEITNYTWQQDKLGNYINVPIDDFNHLMDAFRYAMEQFHMGEIYSF